MERYYRLSELKMHYRMSKSTIYRWIKEDKFPRPVRFSERISRWPKSELDKWEEKNRSRQLNG
ncbi:transcriptional regulator, AlpA family [Pseudidiomarina planktonica]|uniref:Transcriptional regulator, AlpA family n=1 Tax=Pseudidiomarina planktonica TaxID=1323738 RepID=A0A1Y6FY21_9GAMM|nr:AlpA family phage regulatory protein [Pseudidiomarina planktonica]SMQ80530.1 transcriptional regulator, AlpA family [Pseudidiomarina planktonica]